MDTLRVALYSGIIFERDAVSRSLIWKLRLFQRLRDAGYPVEVTAYTQGTDYEDPDIVVLPHLGALLRDPRFDATDLDIFEYGMWYQLFNALVLTDRPSLVVDHNTTPPELVDDPDSKAACHKAIHERLNLMKATRVVTVSEFTREELLGLEFEPDRISVVHLPPSNPFIGRSEHTFAAPANPNLVRMLYVGRLVHAKGIRDLLAAVTSLWDRGDHDLHLTIAGSLRFSDPEVIAEVAEVRLAHELEGRLRLVVDADDEAVAELFGESDLFIMPSHHEGYCIPVIEAMRSGCYVIGTDAGNVPSIMGGLGTVYPTGDVDGLVARMTQFVERVRASRAAGNDLVVPTTQGDMDLTDWHAAVAGHVGKFTLEQYEVDFLQVVAQVLRDRGLQVPEWLTSRGTPVLESA